MVFNRIAKLVYTRGLCAVARRHSLKHALSLSAALVVALLAGPRSASAQGLETQFDSMPIITTKLVLICNGDHPDRLSVGSTWVRTVATHTNGTVSDFFAHMPGGASPIQSNQTTTAVLGLQLPGISRVGDLQKLEFEVPELACVDAFYVAFNDRFIVPVNSAVGATGRHATAPNSHARPGNILVFSLWQGAIQAEAARQDRSIVCALPLKIYPETVQATIENILGNILIRTPDTYFTGDDYVAIVGEGESVSVEFTLHSSMGSVRLLFGLGVSCGPSQPTDKDPNPTGSSISLEVGQVTVQEISDAGGLVAFLDELGFVKGVLEDKINAQLSGMRDGMSELVRNLPLCPHIAFQKSYLGEADPSVIIDGVPILPPSLIIDGIPDLTSIGLPPITLCN